MEILTEEPPFIRSTKEAHPVPSRLHFQKFGRYVFEARASESVLSLQLIAGGKKSMRDQSFVPKIYENLLVTAGMKV